MTGNIHYLHPPPTSIAHFLRIGSTGHRQLEELPSAGKLLPTRYVVDAASYSKQIDLINALQEAEATKINKGDRDMVRIFGKARDRLDRMQEVLSNFYQTLGDPPYPPECRVRGSAQPQSGFARHRP